MLYKYDDKKVSLGILEDDYIVALGHKISINSTEITHVSTSEEYYSHFPSCLDMMCGDKCLYQQFESHYETVSNVS